MAKDYNFSGKIRQATRVAKKLRAFISGPSGAGKTSAALLLAKGLTKQSGGKVLVLDTENGRSDLKKDTDMLGDFSWDTLPVEPEEVSSDMIQAIISYAEASGYEVLVVDSLTHAWEKVTLEHSKMTGNSFTNWKAAKAPFHAMLRKMVGSKVHVIMTCRSKQVYEQSTNSSGKKVVEKLGLSPQVEDSTSYEFDFSFLVGSDHRATMDKSEAGLFEDPKYFIITEATGVELVDWLAEGEEPDLRRKKQILSRIKELVSNFPENKVPESIKSDEELLALSVEEMIAEGTRVKVLLTETETGVAG
jgi:energy-coupling factor transporter ATP-binding protein EcfA2